MMPVRITNARVVLSETILESGSVTVDGDRIEAVGEAPNTTSAIDLGGQFLLPGLIDLHCDAIERALEPRPGVYFPVDYAVVEADRTNAAAGITTAYHALTFEDEEFGRRGPKFGAELIAAMEAHAAVSLIENRIHCRYELTAHDGYGLAHELLAARRVQLLSVMDHFPGERNMTDVRDFLKYMYKTFGRSLSEAEGETIIAKKAARRPDIPEKCAALARMARSANVPLASHDDANPDHARAARELGATLCEFPLDVATARTARELGMSTLVGSPNVIRGGSHMGTLRAVDAVREGVADILCSDYAPPTLLPAVFRLPELTGLSLPVAVRMATRNPAQAAGLDDRGEIAVGMRADLISVALVQGRPHVTGVWVAGCEKFRCHYPK